MTWPNINKATAIYNTVKELEEWMKDLEPPFPADKYVPCAEGMGDHYVNQAPGWAMKAILADEREHDDLDLETQHVDAEEILDYEDGFPRILAQLGIEETPPPVLRAHWFNLPLVEAVMTPIDPNVKRRASEKNTPWFDPDWAYEIITTYLESEKAAVDEQIQKGLPVVKGKGSVPVLSRMLTRKDEYSAHKYSTGLKECTIYWSVSGLIATSPLLARLAFSHTSDDGDIAYFKVSMVVNPRSGKAPSFRDVEAAVATYGKTKNTQKINERGERQFDSMPVTRIGEEPDNTYVTDMALPTLQTHGDTELISFD
ncbi:hypothetical protein E8E11_006002 [Didymella keratinophila]|nr:hypothetical protein E8E11_006002 [Didymella keratinophila]